MNDPFNGINPPAHSLIPPDPPSFRRACIECGRMHDTGLQNMKTGAMIERFEKCRDCIMEEWLKSCQKHWNTAQIDIEWTEEDLKKWRENHQ